METFSKYLKDIPNVKNIDLCNNIMYIKLVAKNQIGDIGLKAFSESLKYIPKLAYLDLGNLCNIYIREKSDQRNRTNGICPKFTMCPKIKQSKSLYIWIIYILVGNNIADNGGIELGRYIFHVKELALLHLGI